MVLEAEPQQFFAWLPAALVHWLVIVATAGSLAFLIAALLVVLVGWREGFDRSVRHFVGRFGAVFRDLLSVAPRRVWALARLGWQESIRRRALVGFVLFLFVVLPMALWFLDTHSPDPAVLYVSSVQWSITLLVLVTVLLLAAVSLPTDLKNKTIFTVVTKPVRASELVLGRVLGIATIGTAMLAVMGPLAFAFIHRALDHKHELSAGALASLDAPGRGDTQAVLAGETSTARFHRHRAVIYADGRGSTDSEQGHWHRVTSHAQGTATAYDVGPPLGQFRARIPLYGRLRFLDRAGKPAEKGSNIGDEWTYQSYIAGGTLAEAIWTFDDVHPERFDQGLRIDLNLRVFRTHKGEIERGIAGSIVLRNPRTRALSAPYNFIAREFVVDPHFLPRKLNDPAGKPIDLFDDLVDDGRLEVVVQCLESGQFFGMADPDLYLLVNEGSVAGNFFKSYVGIWLQVLLIVGVAVMWSTFLSASIAILATLGTLFVGYLRQFVMQLANNELAGGGSLESAMRIVQQKGALVPLEDTWSLRVATAIDETVRWVLWSIAELVPDFRQFSFSDYLAYGYDIPWNLVAIQAVTMIGYLLPALVVGYLCFKFREVAQ